MKKLVVLISLVFVTLFLADLALKWISSANTLLNFLGVLIFPLIMIIDLKIFNSKIFK